MAAGVTILGATGTIGMNTLDVIQRHRGRFEVHALTANTGVEKLHALCRAWQPRYAVMADADSARQLRQRLRADAPATEVLEGMEGLIQVASLPDTPIVMAAIVGAAGLLPTLAAAKAGKKVLLANKEALVLSGRIFMDAVKQHKATLLPIDSEHNAVFQCMPPNFGDGLQASGVAKILLTASGGPFRNHAPEALKNVTPEQACAHPNWVMGRKISVDSATMMNKGLEVIEACWLFDTTPDQVEVVIHPQSIIHSLVEYEDGSVLAQLSNPDMRIPIAHSLAWPERIASGVERLDLAKIARLDFQTADEAHFPCLRLAYQAMQAGGTATAILNAANEVAVEAFLQRRLGFTEIAGVIETTLEKLPGRTVDSLETVLQDDGRAREIAGVAIAGRNP